MGKLTLFLDSIAEWTCKIIKWGLAILMLLIVFEVVSRYAFNSPTIWGQDVQTQVFGICTLSGMAYTLLKKGHVTVDIFLVKMPLRRRMFFELFGYVVWLFPMVCSQVYSWYGQMNRSWKYLEKSTSPWMPPVYPFKTIIFLSFVLLLVQAISEFIKNIISMKRGEEEWIADR